MKNSCNNNRKLFWTTYWSKKYTTIEGLKKDCGTHILSLINEASEPEEYYDFLKKLFLIESFDDAYLLHDKDVVERMILIPFFQEYDTSLTFNELLEKQPPQYIYSVFLEYYLDKHPELLSGTFSLYILDKLGLLTRENLE